MDRAREYERLAQKATDEGDVYGFVRSQRCLAAELQRIGDLPGMYRALARGTMAGGPVVRDFEELARAGNTDAIEALESIAPDVRWCVEECLRSGHPDTMALGREFSDICQIGAPEDDFGDDLGGVEIGEEDGVVDDDEEFEDEEELRFPILPPAPRPKPDVVVQLPSIWDASEQPAVPLGPSLQDNPPDPSSLHSIHGRPRYSRSDLLRLEPKRTEMLPGVPVLRPVGRKWPSGKRKRRRGKKTEEIKHESQRRRTEDKEKE